MIINCERLTKNYGKTQALKDVTFTVEGKGCVGFLGSNGAGKTTTIRILVGLAAPTSGKVEVVGLDIKNKVDIRKEIGYCPQIPTFYNYMTAHEWICWIGSLYKMDKKKVLQRSEELLKLCGIWEERNRKIGGHSGGMKQRLGIAQAMINNPKLLVLDEPVSALDPKGRYEILKLMEELKKEMTIFMSTHILDDIERVAEKVIIVDDGKVILSETIEDLRQKYIEPIIEFNIKNMSDDLTTIISKEKWVSKVNREGKYYKVFVNDFELARKHLPKIIVNQDAILDSYSISNSTLEDIFLKVVNK